MRNQAVQKEEKIGRVFKKFVEGEKKVEWQKILATELVMNQINPIYVRSFILNSVSYNKIEIKLEVWQSNTG